MGIYTVKIDEETKEGKSILELLKNLKSVEIESEEDQYLIEETQKALDDPEREVEDYSYQKFRKDFLNADLCR